MGIQEVNASIPPGYEWDPYFSAKDQAKVGGKYTSQELIDAGYISPTQQSASPLGGALGGGSIAGLSEMLGMGAGMNTSGNTGMGTGSITAMGYNPAYRPMGFDYGGHPSFHSGSWMFGVPTGADPGMMMKDVVLAQIQAQAQQSAKAPDFLLGLARLGLEQQNIGLNKRTLGLREEEMRNQMAMAQKQFDLATKKFGVERTLGIMAPMLRAIQMQYEDQWRRQSMPTATQIGSAMKLYG